MLRKSDCSEIGAPQKKAAALKKELLQKSNSCVTLKKFSLKKCEEVAFSKIELSENIATYARSEIAIP